ncbi:hypothetical protein BC829DRAFT_213448 [Chytridium lagenaria]|nr:hypothetical protein BC829DRAFT_213448 [Chytridium lagenaria]
MTFTEVSQPFQFTKQAITPEERQRLLSEAVHALHFPSLITPPSLQQTTDDSKEAPRKKCNKRDVPLDDEEVAVGMEERSMAPPRLILKPKYRQGSSGLPLLSSVNLSPFNFGEDKALQEALPSSTFSKKKRTAPEEENQPLARTFNFADANIDTPFSPPLPPPARRLHKMTGSHSRGSVPRKTHRKPASFNNSAAFTGTLRMEVDQMAFGFKPSLLALSASSVALHVPRP